MSEEKIIVCSSDCGPITSKLHFNDCLKAMRDIKTGSVDMLFTDLPYGITNCKWDTPIDLSLFWLEVNRIVKPNGAKVLFSQTPFDKVLGYSNLKQLRYEWIWEKNQATGYLNAKKMPMKAHENILVFYDKQPVYNAQKTHDHKPVNTYTKYIDTQNRSEIYGKTSKEVSGGGNTDRYPRSVLKGPSDKQTCHLHPTQKPVWLCEFIVKTYTNPSDIVLDCCAGSGSIGIACQNTGRSYIGIENDNDTYDTMVKRLTENARKNMM